MSRTSCMRAILAYHVTLVISWQDLEKLDKQEKPPDVGHVMRTEVGADNSGEYRHRDLVL